MKYSVTMGSYPICQLHPSIVGPVPGTLSKVVLDTDEGTGRMIYDDYLVMRDRQKITGVKVGWEFAGIELTSEDPEIDKFREAINLLFRFLAGDDSDNCRRVYDIEVWKACDLEADKSDETTTTRVCADTSR